MFSFLFSYLFLFFILTSHTSRTEDNRNSSPVGTPAVPPTKLNLKEGPRHDSESMSTLVQAHVPLMVEGWKAKNNGERVRDAEGFRVRAAGVCLQNACDGTKILLVSGGKDGRHWVVPGGGVERDEGHEAAARREVEEEAGVRAQAVGQIGVFQDDTRKHRTTVYIMRVVEELDEWEDGLKGRRRAWMSLEEGALRVKEAQKPILHAVMQR